LNLNYLSEIKSPFALDSISTINISISETIDCTLIQWLYVTIHTRLFSFIM